MFTLTTNLAVWMAAVVDESVHQASFHSTAPGNASHAHRALDRECPLWVAPGPSTAGPQAGHWFPCRVGLLLRQALTLTCGCG